MQNHGNPNLLHWPLHYRYVGGQRCVEGFLFVVNHGSGHRKYVGAYEILTLWYCKMRKKIDFTSTIESG